MDSLYLKNPIPNGFRVFDLFPRDEGTDDDALLQGQTRVLPIETDVNYETLSYVWGNDPEDRRIQVDGEDVHITLNLFAALERLRLPDRVRTLWIDQICISQTDPSEKANQIPLMGQIYSSAKRGVIWMGELPDNISSEDAIAAFEFLAYISDTGGDRARAESLKWPSCLSSSEAMSNTMQAIWEVGSQRNPWWMRMWTLQEAILPRDSTMLYGPASISWDTLARASHTCTTRGWAPPSVQQLYRPHLAALKSITTQVNGLQYARGKSEGPLRTASRWRFRKASVPLDKVYGFLGLFPPGTLGRVERADYALPPAVVYQMFTVDMIECEKNLHPIALWNANDFQQSTPNMPSWAPDLRSPGREFVDLPVNPTPVDGDDSITWYLMNNYGWYNAAAGSEIDWSKFSYNENLGHLMLTGHAIDEVAVVGEALLSKQPGSKHVTDEEVINHIRAWLELAEADDVREDPINDNSDSSPRQTAFWRGLIGDVVGENQDPERRANGDDLASVKHFVETGERAGVCQEIFATMVHRTFIITKSRRIAFCPRDTGVGDELWLLRGSRVPFVVRATSSGGSDALTCVNERIYHFIGPAYVDAIMDGDAFRDAECVGITLA